MLLVGIYHETLKKKKLGIDKTMLAARVIPFLIPLSIEPTLNVKQVSSHTYALGGRLQECMIIHALLASPI